VLWQVALSSNPAQSENPAKIWENGWISVGARVGVEIRYSRSNFCWKSLLWCAAEWRQLVNAVKNVLPAQAAAVLYAFRRLLALCRPAQGSEIVAGSRSLGGEEVPSDRHEGRSIGPTSRSLSLWLQASLRN